MVFARAPQVYVKFVANSTEIENSEEFCIQDLTEEFYEEAAEFMVANHAKGAVMHRAARTFATKSGLENVMERYRNLLREKTSLICLKLDTQEIVGVNALTVKTKENLIKPDVSFFLSNLKI